MQTQSLKISESCDHNRWKGLGNMLYLGTLGAIKILLSQTPVRNNRPKEVREPGKLGFLLRDLM